MSAVADAITHSRSTLVPAPILYFFSAIGIVLTVLIGAYFALGWGIDIHPVDTYFVVTGWHVPAAAFFLVGAAAVVVVIVPFWAIFRKAGFPGALAILMVVPLVNFVLLYVLAFSSWKSRGTNFVR